MKRWILSHKILAIVLACVLGAGAVCAVVLQIALEHKHEFSTEWSTDENYHWHKCKDEKCNEVSDKAAHVFDKEIVSATYLASEATYTDAAKYYKSCVCGVKGTETFEHGSSLSAKENVVGLKEGVTLGKVYDGEAYALAAEEITRNGNGEVTVMYQRKGGVDFGNTAPKNVGEYTVKVSVAATAEWKEAEKTFDFAITAKPLTGVTATKEYDGNATIVATPDRVVAGDAVTATITMTSKNVGATVKEVTLDGAAKDNYTLSLSDVDASITAKQLTATATKEYDGNAGMPASLMGVIDGETVTAAITMTSKNVGATVKEVMLDGKDKDNYTIETDAVTASITPMKIGVEWEHEYNNSKILTGEPAELLKGDEATITVTMESANVGATVRSFEITGKDAGNYSLAREDVFVEIIKADIANFTINNAAAFEKGFYVGATNIPDPETNYAEIGTGYGAKTIVWEKQLEGGVWSRNLTKEEVMQSKTGTFQVRIKYEEGDNYKFGATPSVRFTLNAKPRILNVMNFDGKTYDGTPVANFNYDALEDTVEITDLPGVNDLTSPYNGEKYVEFRRKGEVLWTKVTDAYIPKNAAEYEYRIGIKATEEWEAVVSDIKSFTITQVEIKLEKGYVTTSAILQNGDLLYLASHTPVAGENIALRLVNGKAGLELSDTNPNYVKLDQKKKVSVQNNLDCFRLTSTSNSNLSNYKIVKDPKQTSVEITVPPSGKGISKQITGTSQSTGFDPNQKLLSIWTTVNTGSFQVGQTVIVSDNTGAKLFEAKIVKVGVVDPNGDGTYNIISQSGCVIPSDGKIRIEFDVTGITYDVNKVKGGTVKVK